MARTVQLIDAANTLEIGQTIKVYYPDSGSGNPVIRQGTIDPPKEGKPSPVQADRVTVTTSRGPRTLLYARMQGTLEILKEN